DLLVRLVDLRLRGALLLPAVVVARVAIGVRLWRVDMGDAVHAGTGVLTGPSDHVAVLRKRSHRASVLHMLYDRTGVVPMQWGRTGVLRRRRAGIAVRRIGSASSMAEHEQHGGNGHHGGAHGEHPGRATRAAVLGLAHRGDRDDRIVHRARRAGPA